MSARPGPPTAHASGAMPVAAVGSAAFVLGLGAWLALAALSGRREAWDSPLYFALVMPALTLLAGLGGWRAPARPWVGPTALALGQFVGLVIGVGAASLNLWPLSLAFLGVIHLPALGLARLGARWRLGRTRRR